MSQEMQVSVEQLKIEEKYIQIGVKASTWEEAIRIACEPLVKDNVITKEYANDVIKRETMWPTGLRVLPYGVAIPHGENMNNVISAAIGVVLLKEEVLFKEAGVEDGEIGVKVIFLLAMKEPEAQLELLSSLMKVLANQEALAQIEKATTAEEFIIAFNSAKK